MKNILLTLTLLLPCFVTAQNDTQHKIDSLRQAISMQHGLDKLNSYHLLCGYLFNIGSLEDLQTLFGEYETALVQEQPDYYFKHYLLLIDALNASMKYEECRQEAKNTYEEAKERNDTIGMFYSVFSLADIDAKQYRLAG